MKFIALIVERESSLKLEIIGISSEYSVAYLIYKLVKWGSDVNLNTDIENLWIEFGKSIKSFINAKISNEQDAEDILQIVFLKIYCNLDQLKETDKLRSWIYSITRNSIIDFYRRKSKETYLSYLTEDLLNVEHEEETLNNEISQCLKSMLQYLPEIYKEAIVLTEIQGLTQKELALRTGLSISGAKSRVQRARRLLKDMLMNCCIVELDHRGNVIDFKHKCKDCKYC